MAHMPRLLILSLLICSLTQAQAQKPSWEYPTAKVRGWHAQAIAVALREFQRHQGGKNEYGEPGYGDLRHYEVWIDRKSTRLNSSHLGISYAVFCLKKKKKKI